MNSDPTQNAIHRDVGSNACDLGASQGRGGSIRLPKSPHGAEIRRSRAADDFISHRQGKMCVSKGQTLVRHTVLKVCTNAPEKSDRPRGFAAPALRAGKVGARSSKNALVGYHLTEKFPTRYQPKANVQYGISGINSNRCLQQNICINILYHTVNAKYIVLYCTVMLSMQNICILVRRQNWIIHTDSAKKSENASPAINNIIL